MWIQKVYSLIAPNWELITMPTMKIHGGDLDIIEKEFSSFFLGANFKTLGYEKKKEATNKKICFDCPKV